MRPVCADPIMAQADAAAGFWTFADLPL